MEQKTIFGAPGFDFSEINAIKFAEIWNHFDKDKSGYMEGKELDHFVEEVGTKILQKKPTKEEFKSLKKTLMSAYDLEKNGKISMVELAQMLLPNEQVFLLLFRRSVPLGSSVKFMEIWRKYDRNLSGFLTVPELENFVTDFVNQSGEMLHPNKIKEYAKSIMDLYDRNNDGLLDLKDLAQLLNLTENFLLSFRIEDSSQEERKRDFEKIFRYYDVGNTGALEGVEIDGFVKDMMEVIRGPLSANELNQFKEAVMKHSDANKDGKIQKAELAVCLGIHLKK
ncbi:secretagogin-like [Styela clava]|uniref:secretagogin-like n=1 Tax=Styela clava TaxID=7725 RepID=UPI001939F52A|nr:secretagogin-like [Styela clava]